MCHLCSGLPAHAVFYSRIPDCGGIANMPHLHPNSLKVYFLAVPWLDLPKIKYKTQIMQVQMELISVIRGSKEVRNAVACRLNDCNKRVYAKRKGKIAVAKKVLLKRKFVDNLIICCICRPFYTNGRGISQNSPERCYLTLG
jgi:hypothetical protein